MTNQEENRSQFSLRRLGYDAELEISREEFETIELSKDLYFRIIRIEEYFDAVLEDYAELEETLSHYGIRHLVFHSFEFHLMRNVINRRLLHLLSTARLYRDGLLKHGKTLLKNGDAFQQIKNELNDSTQQPMEFRIVEALRNYSQHEDFPISSMTTGSQWEIHNETREKKRGAHYLTVNIDASEISKQRKLPTDVRDALVEMGPNAEMICHIRKYVEHLGSIHAEFRKLVNGPESQWEKTMRNAMGSFQRSADDIALPFLVYATKRRPNGTEIQLFEDFFERLVLLRQKNGIQATLSKRYVRWSGTPSEE